MTNDSGRAGVSVGLITIVSIVVRLLALLVSFAGPAAWAQDPSGAEFQVNSYTTNGQYRSAVASLANGDFVVVWTSAGGQDGHGRGVFGRLFNASGVPQGGEFQVNSHTSSHQWRPAVASDPSGNFVVVWESYSQDVAQSWGVFGQRFDAEGVPQGDEFQVNSYTTNHQRFPGVASDAAGNFVCVWRSLGQDSALTWGVFGQRFDVAGVPQGGEFQVNSYTTSQQNYPAVTAAANGSFVVVWRSDDQDGSLSGVFGQRFSATGAPQGSEFQVNSYTTNRQSWYGPAVASDTNGNFVVVWESRDQDGSSYGVLGQRYSAAGVPQGSEFQVNSYTTNIQSFPSAASDGAGNFVVVWRSVLQDGNNDGVFGQRFDAAGAPQGSEFQVNSYTTGQQTYPAVAANPNGNFAVVWQSVGQDGSDRGIFGQRFGDLIFEDGFE